MRPSGGLIKNIKIELIDLPKYVDAVKRTLRPL
jgi:hypothetical protein